MSVLLIHNPHKATTDGFHQYQPELFTKINWKVFITPVILTLVLAFGLSAFETLFSLYTADKVNYTPKRYFDSYYRWRRVWRIIPGILL